MNRRITQMSALLITMVAFLCIGQGSVHIGGVDGLALLKNITDISSNLTRAGSAMNNTSASATESSLGNISKDVRISQGSAVIGNNGKVSLENLSNKTLNLTGTNNSSGLWAWGGKPLVPHLPTAEDYILYRDADVVKANRE